MAVSFVKTLDFKPGVQRDTTQLDSDTLIDAQWTRIYAGRPRKIGGMFLMSAGNSEIIRNLYGVPKSRSLDVYNGRKSTLTFINKNFQGLGDVETDRTPVGFVPQENNQWVFDTYINDVSFTPITYIIANVNNNRDDITGTNEGPIYYGDINATTPLVAIPAEVASGGILQVQPFLFGYGNDGVIFWNSPNNITSWPSANVLAISGSKIVAGARTNGNGAPAALFWSLDSLYRVIFAPTAGKPDDFSSQLIRDQISILGSNAIVQVNQQFFWPGNGEFLTYNGTVETVPNDMNSNYFFDSLNRDQAQKMYGVYIPRFKEIWWFYATIGSTENNRVLIYSLIDGSWNNTILSRAAAFNSSVFPYPIMSDSSTLIDPNYPPNSVYGLWMHEFGWNRVQFNQSYAIEAWFQTPYMSLGLENPQMDRQMRVLRLEPDFIQTNQNMYVEIYRKAFANDPAKISLPKFFNQSTHKIDMETNPPSSMGRFISLKFTSNTVDDTFQMGKCILDYNIGDVTPNS